MIAGVAPATEAPPELAPIVYVDRGQLCSIAPTGGVESHCLKSQREFGSPFWRPDGLSLVVERGIHDGPQALALIDPRGRFIRSLADSSDHYRPVWSPAGRSIYAIRYDLGPAVARWSADGRKREIVPVTGLANEKTQFQMISLSPSGRRAALLTMQFREMVIATVSPGGLAAEKVLPAGFAYVSQSVWLDEKRLLFVGKRTGDRGALWELDVESGTATRRGIDRLWLGDSIAISPDHESVVVSATPDVSPAAWNLWRFPLRSGKAVRLTRGADVEDVEPSWRR
jgi:Tol biopolymer transport system component